MAIGNVIERGGFIYVYDEKGRQVFTVPKGSQPGDGLKGYTAATVNVKRGPFIYTYDDKGHQTAAVPA